MTERDDVIRESHETSVITAFEGGAQVGVTEAVVNPAPHSSLHAGRTRLRQR